VPSLVETEDKENDEKEQEEDDSNNNNNGEESDQSDDNDSNVDEERRVGTSDNRSSSHKKRPQYDASSHSQPVQHARRLSPPHQKKKKSSSFASRFAQQSLRWTARAVARTAQHSGQAAYYLMQPKQVELSELLGVWRLDQEITMPRRSSPEVKRGTGRRQQPPRRRDTAEEALVDVRQARATIEIMGRSTTDHAHEIHYTTVLGQPERAVYHFQPAQWPRLARLEFTARAFAWEDDDHHDAPPNHPDINHGDPKQRQGPPRQRQRLPPLYLYRGYVTRKLADPSVIKFKGNIYRLEKTGWRGQTIRKVAIGTFVARRRLQLDVNVDHDENDNDDDDEQEEEEEDLEEEEGDDEEEGHDDNESDEGDYD